MSGEDDPEPDSGDLLPPTGDASLSGTEQVGQTLTGSDNFSGATTIERGWLRCNAGGTGCSVISGQTSTTYTLVNADADKVIKFRVRGTSVTGGVHEDDAVTGVIDAISPANGTAPSFTGRPPGGQVLTRQPRARWTGHAHDHLRLPMAALQPRLRGHPGRLRRRPELHAHVGATSDNRPAEGHGHA